MPSLANRPEELIGFFSYSREDDEDSRGALSDLRDRIQRELRGQLGRRPGNFRLWQDKESIAPGKLWEAEINNAIDQSVFFIPIITPTVVGSEYCRTEFESFLAREKSLGRADLIFPILYIRVPALEDSALRRDDTLLSIIARRQYVDWRELRHRDVHSEEVRRAIERFCSQIVDTLTASPQATATKPQRAPVPQEAVAPPQPAASVPPPPVSAPRPVADVVPVVEAEPPEMPAPAKELEPVRPAPPVAEPPRPAAAVSQAAPKVSQPPPGATIPSPAAALFGTLSAGSADASLWPCLGLVALLLLIDGVDTLTFSVAALAERSYQHLYAIYVVFGLAELVTFYGTLWRKEWTRLLGPAVCAFGIYAAVRNLANQTETSFSTLVNGMMLVVFLAAAAVYVFGWRQDLTRLLTRRPQAAWGAFIFLLALPASALVLSSVLYHQWWRSLPVIAATVVALIYALRNVRKIGSV